MLENPKGSADSLVLTELRVRQNNFDQANLASDVPELVQVKTSLLDNVTELSWLTFNAVDDREHAKITSVRESGEVTIVGWERCRSRRQLRVTMGGVHNLVAMVDICG